MSGLNEFRAIDGDGDVEDEIAAFDRCPDARNDDHAVTVELDLDRVEVGRFERMDAAGRLSRRYHVAKPANRPAAGAIVMHVASG